MTTVEPTNGDKSSSPTDKISASSHSNLSALTETLMRTRQEILTRIRLNETGRIELA